MCVGVCLSVCVSVNISTIVMNAMDNRILPGMIQLLTFRSSLSHTFGRIFVYVYICICIHMYMNTFI